MEESVKEQNESLLQENAELKASVKELKDTLSYLIKQRDNAKKIISQMKDQICIYNELI